MFSIVATIGKNGELSKDGKSLFRLPKITELFNKLTTEHKVLMGRKTWESLPQKLPNRENIVVSRSLPTSEKGADASQPDLILKDLSSFISDHESSPDEIFIIGGGMLYWETLKHCKKLYLAEIDASADADVFFPKFDKSLYSKDIIEKGSDNGLDYTVSLYTQK